MIDDEEYQRLADHIMHVYCRPLVLYFLRTSLRRVGNLLQGHSMNEKAYEFVSGFFESRLTRRDYFDNWRKSGRRLHEYLISGLFYYKKELCRNSSRKAMVEMAEDPIIEEESGGSIDRDRAVELMRRAVSLALAEVKGSSLEEHVEMFVTRTCRGLSHKGSAEMFSADVERARRMFRTGKERVERCFRKVLAQEGVEHIDREICDLKEVINS